MAKEGYVVFVVSARRHREPDGEWLHLDNLDGNGASFIPAARDVVGRLAKRTTPHRRERYESAFGFSPPGDSWSGGGRLFIHGEAGPYGRRGRLRHVDSGDTHPYSAKDAALTPLRAGLIARPHEPFGFLLCERRSVNHLRAEIEEAVLRPIAAKHKVHFEVATHVDHQEWEDFLEDADVASVSAVYHSTKKEDYGPNITRQPNLTITATGAAARRLGMPALAKLRHAVQSGGVPDAIHLSKDLKPGDTDYEHDRTTLQAIAGKQKRTVVFEQDGVPQWIYRHEQRVSDPGLQQEWDELTARIWKPYLTDGGSS